MIYVKTFILLYNWSSHFQLLFDVLHVLSKPSDFSKVQFFPILEYQDIIYLPL